MELTERQLGRIEAALWGIEENAKGRSNTISRLTKVIIEQLQEAEAEALPEEDLREDLQQQNCEKNPAAVRAYGQELLTEGCGMKNLITLTMEHFGMTQTAFANLIGVNQGNLSGYLKHGFRRKCVLKALAEFFGFDGGAGTETEEE